MIVARAGKLVIIGLTDENLKRLKEKEPMSSTSLPDVDLFIFNGPTEQDMIEELRSFMGPDTEVVDMRDKH